ncbi:MAG: hypothetical protein Q8K67_02695 [Geothrix sp.]|nr:hypothetical protein [Geothrix sp.]
MAETVGMVAITSRSLIHNLNEIKRLEKNHFGRLGQSETKTVKACSHELKALALYYKKYVASRRLGIDILMCEEIENYFNNIATAMDHLRECINDQPMAIHTIYDTYEHGHTSWSLDGGKRSSDINNVIMQLWHDGNAADWFLSKNATPMDINDDSLSSKQIAKTRQDELITLAQLMHKLSFIYQGLKEQYIFQSRDMNRYYPDLSASAS